MFINQRLKKNGLFKYKENIKPLLIFILTVVSCKTPKPIAGNKINFSHFNHLYKEINFHEKDIGIIHIYSEYPDYQFEIEPDEGFACVDDAARALVLLSTYIKAHKNDIEAYDKLKKLAEFVLQMQHKNGYFNNFIKSDLSVNTTYRTSVAEANWWSFRALWGLESAYELLRFDKAVAGNIEVAVAKLLMAIKRDIPIRGTMTKVIKKVEVPTWLPQQSAADQSALLILGLLKNYKRTGDAHVKKLIDILAKGIMVMQKGDANKYPYGVFLSWQNQWHAWGNSQAYALLKAGQQFNNQDYINSALKEVDNFYPYVLKNGFAESFWIKKNEDTSFTEIERNQYPQIVYGLRPMIWASLEAYHYSKKEKYMTLATALAQWLQGQNDAKSIIYHPNTGICYDGIIGNNKVNKNSGAESAIECLLILLEMDKLK